jgi:hypothetical protein
MTVNGAGRRLLDGQAAIVEDEIKTACTWEVKVVRGLESGGCQPYLGEVQGDLAQVSGPHRRRPGSSLDRSRVVIRVTSLAKCVLALLPVSLRRLRDHLIPLRPAATRVCRPANVATNPPVPIAAICGCGGA